MSVYSGEVRGGTGEGSQACPLLGGARLQYMPAHLPGKPVGRDGKKDSPEHERS